jgi:hypothetical protein
MITFAVFCHSGLDPWFDRPFDRLTVLSEVEGLTTLSTVEGEFRAFSAFWNSKYRQYLGPID